MAQLILPCTINDRRRQCMSHCFSLTLRNSSDKLHRRPSDEIIYNSVVFTLSLMVSLIAFWAAQCIDFHLGVSVYLMWQPFESFPLRKYLANGGCQSGSTVCDVSSFMQCLGPGFGFLFVTMFLLTVGIRLLNMGLSMQPPIHELEIVCAINAVVCSSIRDCLQDIFLLQFMTAVCSSVERYQWLENLSRYHSQRVVETYQSHVPWSLEPKNCVHVIWDGGYGKQSEKFWECDFNTQHHVFMNYHHIEHSESTSEWKSYRHLIQILIETTMRIGEAKNPGPVDVHDMTGLVAIGTINPTSITSKLETLYDLGPGIWSMSKRRLQLDNNNTLVAFSNRSRGML